MSTGLAAVQARIAQIQSQFGTAVGAVTVRATPAVASVASPAATASFSQALTASTASLASLPTASPTASASPAGATAPASGGGRGQQVVDIARQHLGTPYLWGGEAPGGFDCSGLIQWSYGQLGIDLPRVSRDQAKVGRPVSPADARPGDLVFFERGKIDHIGLYAGSGQWVVAPRTGDVVKMQDVDLSKATTIRRILPDEAPARGAATAPTPVPATTAPTTSGAAGSTPYAALFARAGAAHGVSPALLTAVARAESGFDAGARSPAGAQGLMQFMPATARGLGVNPWDPASAVDGAARLLKQHLTRFGATELALAAYNAGPGAVTKHGGVPPYAETQAYVAKIMAELRGRA